jgi:hypothetical protein
MGHLDFPAVGRLQKPDQFRRVVIQFAGIRGVGARDGAASDGVFDGNAELWRTSYYRLIRVRRVANGGAILDGGGLQEKLIVITPDFRTRSSIIITDASKSAEKSPENGEYIFIKLMQIWAKSLKFFLNFGKFIGWIFNLNDLSSVEQLMWRWPWFVFKSLARFDIGSIGSKFGPVALSRNLRLGGHFTQSAVAFSCSCAAASCASAR